MSYPIENGIPVPAKQSCARPARFPVRNMTVGDSFLVPTRDIYKHMEQAVRNCATHYGFKIATRKVSGGVRIWRVK